MEQRAKALESHLAKMALQKEQIHAIKLANQQAIPEKDYTEEETRQLFIDLLLREAGWAPNGTNVREFPVEGMPNPSGKGNVDYVLWGDDGLPLPVVEAKRTRNDPTQGQQQAKLYADCLKKKYGQRPFIFYTNGYQTWLWDNTNYPPREV